MQLVVIFKETIMSLKPNTLEETLEQLTALVQENQTALVEETAKRAEETARHAEETARHTEETARHVEEIARHVEETARFVEETAKRIELEHKVESLQKELSMMKVNYAGGEGTSKLNSNNLGYISQSIWKLGPFILVLPMVMFIYNRK
jgi:hypothetical protein